MILIKKETSVEHRKNFVGVEGGLVQAYAWAAEEAWSSPGLPLLALRLG